MNLISTTPELEALCAELASCPYITVDTEFLRESTFWPILCLIQTAGHGVEGMIDPLAEDIDLQPFYDLMVNPNVLKVMHGCRQDVEIFHHLAGIIPAPLFDTQIAAMVCGFGDAVGYETLIRQTVGGNVDKASRFTDWSRRPLSDAQLTYALSDVTHLRDAYEFLEAALDKNGRRSWLEEESNLLSDPEVYLQRPENAWRRLRMQDRRPKVLGVLIEVAKWRDTEAQTLLEAIALGRNKKPEDLPDVPPAVVNRPGIGPLVELLKVLLKQRSEETQVAPKLIANVADLERMASDAEPDVPAMSGWRREIFGQYALDLKQGRLALASENDAVILVTRDA